MRRPVNPPRGKRRRTDYIEATRDGHGWAQVAAVDRHGQRHSLIRLSIEEVADVMGALLGDPQIAGISKREIDEYLAYIRTGPPETLGADLGFGNPAVVSMPTPIEPLPMSEADERMVEHARATRDEILQGGGQPTKKKTTRKSVRRKTTRGRKGSRSTPRSEDPASVSAEAPEAAEE